MTPPTVAPGLRERIAELEHVQWARWAKSILESESISGERVIRWRRLIKTPYADLTEAEKDLDREWADRVLALLGEQEPVARPVVMAFASVMEAKLREHDPTKGSYGWQSDDPLALLARAEEELAELRGVLQEMESSRRVPSRHHAGDPEDTSFYAFIQPIREEAADVANMVMMVADVCGALVAPIYWLGRDIADPRGPSDEAPTRHDPGGTTVTYDAPLDDERAQTERAIMSMLPDQGDDAYEVAFLVGYYRADLGERPSVALDRFRSGINAALATEEPKS